ncbi:MAG: internalin [Verrucomicrobiota bacterium]|jgi:hypothetical protein
MSTQSEFIAWALSPDRNLEEAYCAERLVELGYQQWCRSHGQDQPSLEKQAAVARKRRLNPAHRARLFKTIVTRATSELASMTCVGLDANNDRPLRDISALRFFPQLKILSLYGHEFRDISVLRKLPAVESVGIGSEALEDFSPLGALSGLKSLHLVVLQPWPEVKGFEALTELESFHWTGNLLVLEGISRLGKVREARIMAGAAANVPLRDASHLPEMPWLEELELEGIHHLDGITRWPRLRNLIVGGSFKDISPLGGLRGLTHLSLRGEGTRDLSPLAQLPDLQRLTIQSQHPQDFSVLAETPRLHEVRADGCSINRLELATLHAVLAPWDDEFAAWEPRQCGRARFLTLERTCLPGNPRVNPRPAPNLQDDKQMLVSEARWFENRLSAALHQLFGHKNWGHACCKAPGLGSIILSRVESAEQTGAIVEATRRLLCGTLRPWHVLLSVSLEDEERSAEASATENSDPDEEAIQREVDRYKMSQRQRLEKDAYLEREHRMRLLAQEGKPVKPDEFAAPESPKIYRSAAEEMDNLGRRDGELLSDVEKLWMDGVITEEGFFADVRCRAAAEHLMGRKAGDAAA